MRLVNNSEYNLSHDDVCFKIGETMEVNAKLAKLWLQFDGVEEVITKEDVEEAVKQALADKKTKKK